LHLGNPHEPLWCFCLVHVCSLCRSCLPL